MAFTTYGDAPTDQRWDTETHIRCTVKKKKKNPALAFYGEARSPPAQAFAVFQQRAALTLPSVATDSPPPSGRGSVAQSESAQPETEVPADPSPSTKGSRGVRGRLAGRTGERWPACGHPTTLGGRNPQRMGSATQRGAGLDGGLVEVGVMCRMAMKERAVERQQSRVRAQRNGWRGATHLNS